MLHNRLATFFISAGTVIDLIVYIIWSALIVNLFYKFIYLFPCAAIHHILKTILLKYGFGLSASVATAAENNNVFFAFKFC